MSHLWWSLWLRVIVTVSVSFGFSLKKKGGQCKGVSSWRWSSQSEKVCYSTFTTICFVLTQTLEPVFLLNVNIPPISPQETLTLFFPHPEDLFIFGAFFSSKQTIKQNTWLTWKVTCTLKPQRETFLSFWHPLRVYLPPSSSYFSYNVTHFFRKSITWFSGFWCSTLTVQKNSIINKNGL